MHCSCCLKQTTRPAACIKSPVALSIGFGPSCPKWLWRAQARRSATALGAQPRQTLEGLLRQTPAAVAGTAGPAAAAAAAPTRGRCTCRRCAAWRPTKRCWCGLPRSPVVALYTCCMAQAEATDSKHTNKATWLEHDASLSEIVRHTGSCMPRYQCCFRCANLAVVALVSVVTDVLHGAG